MSQLQHTSDSNPNTNRPPPPYCVSPQLRNADFPRSPLTGNLIPRDYLGARSDPQALIHSGVVTPRKPTPSPLNTTDWSRPDHQDDFGSPQSPLSPRSLANTAHLPNCSPTSRITHAAFSPAPPTTGQKSTRPWAGDRPLDDLTQHDQGMNAQANDVAPRKASDTTESIQSAASSPISLVGSLQSMPGERTLGHRAMPRTSSIDSAISSLSSASHPHKSSFDASAVTQADIEHLITTAGSPEAVILHLLKEKHHAASQNSQLWRLVDKQRTLILGLNKDLERALKEKDRYKKKAKELQNSVPPVPSTNDHIIVQSRAAGNGVTSVSHESSKAEQTQTESIRSASPNMGVPGLCKNAVLASAVESHPSSRSLGAPKLTTMLDTGLDNELSQQERIGESDRRGKSPSPQTSAYSRQELPTASPTSLASSSSALNEASSGEDQQRGLPHPSRKPPPAPLNLSRTEFTAMGHPSAYDSASEYEDILEVDELPIERGRRKTRDDDDREREVALAKDKEVESWQTVSHPTLSTVSQESSAPIRSPRIIHVPLSSDQPAIMAPKSPGLPLSPRPEDRPLGSPLPRMPREMPNSLALLPTSSENSLAGLALSPRVAQQSNSFASGTSTSMGGSFHTDASGRPIPSIDTAVRMESPRSPYPVGIYQGLVSEEYPNLLLPPNALPLIRVKTSSSRLRPSRNSYLAPKPSEEEPVFTLSVFSRSKNLELWRVEKVIAALPQLDQQVRQSSALWVKLPDRSIFSGHSPAKIDARRAALNFYFEALLDTPVDEKAALAICHFLTADAIEPRDDETSLLKGNSKAAYDGLRDQDGKPKKEGYLAKKGKNFGGWKARYFILHGPELRYFESPGGPHLGTIKIHNAQIGKQSQTTTGQSNSSSGVDDDSDDQYRHAFIILEPKKKDSSALVRHVLCAESDEERDAWVEALLEYAEGHSDNEGSDNMTSQSQGQVPAKQLISQAAAKQKFFPKKNSKGMIITELGATDTVQGFSYDDAVPAEPPVLGAPTERIPPKSPMFPSESVADSAGGNQASEPVQVSSKVISGPTNGAVIQDAGAWGNKTVTSTKEKKRSIWGFRTRSSYDLASQLQASHESPTAQAPSGPPLEKKDFVRPVFGIPLAEAVQFCAPQGVDVDLPAVVYRCIEYLQAKGAAAEEGIFRLSGSNLVVKALRERFNTEGDVDFLAGDDYYDVHAVASLFKQYLRELPTTVLTRELHLEFLRVLELAERQKKILAFNSLVHRLPKPNLALLRALVQFLIVIVNNSDVNKMTIRNISIVFAPTLNIPAPVFSMLLTDFETIFDELPDAQVEPTEQRVDSPSLSEDIRSPRHQMSPDLPTPTYSQTFRRPAGTGDDSNIHYDTGLASMKPTYEPSLEQNNRDHPNSPSMRMLMPMTDSSRSAKAKRRESSMLFMDYNHHDSAF